MHEMRIGACLQVVWTDHQQHVVNIHHSHFLVAPHCRRWTPRPIHLFIYLFNPIRGAKSIVHARIQEHAQTHSAFATPLGFNRRNCGCRVTVAGLAAVVWQICLCGQREP